MDCSEVTIQRLINSMYFGLETVFILVGEKNYRLIGLNGEVTKMDKEYRTLRGAKIAFSKFFDHSAYRQGVKAEWTHSYPVDADWLSPKMEICIRNKEKEQHAVQ